MIRYWLAMVLVCCGVVSVSAAQKLPETEVERLAHTIWYPINMKPAVAPIHTLLKTQLARGNWKEAIGTAAKLTPLIPRTRPDYLKEQPLEWRVAVGELYLYDLAPDLAATKFQSVLDAVPAPRNGPGRSFARQAASYGMARVAAETGDFPAAVKWLERAPGEYWSGCGNCMEGEQIQAHPMLTVWKAAQQPEEKAVPALEAVIAGKFQPTRVHLHNAKAIATSQKAHARAEAALILGELHLRNGRPKEAREALEIAAESSLDIARIARSYLKRESTRR